MASEAEATSKGSRVVEHVRRAVIITALAIEARAVRCHLADIEREDHPGGGVYTRGRLGTLGGPWDVLVAQAGRHNETAALETERAIDHWRPELVLLVGVAGGLKDVAVGDVVAATKVYAYATGKQEDAFLPRPELQRGAHHLVQLANYLGLDDRWAADLFPPGANMPRVFVEPIASGPVVLASSLAPLRAFLRQTYGDAVAIEQEGYGFLTALNGHIGIPALVVRGISDTLDDKAAGVAEARDDDTRQMLAAANASAFAFALIGAYRPRLAARDDNDGSTAVSDDFPDPLPVARDAMLRAVEGQRPSQESCARAFMRVVVAAIDQACTDATSSDVASEAYLRAALAAAAPPAVAFAEIASVIAAEDARDAATALLAGFADLVERFPAALMPRPSEEVVMFLAHEFYLTLVAALLRAGRWETLADLLGRHIFATSIPGGYAPNDVPVTLLARSGELLAARGRLHGQRMPPLRAVLLHERHAGAGSLATAASLTDLVDADFLLWLWHEAARERVRERASWRPHLLTLWADPPPLLARAVQRRTASGLALALGLAIPAPEVAPVALQHFLSRQLEHKPAETFEWRPGALADLGRIGTI